MKPDLSAHVRLLTEGSVWLDSQMRTVVVFRVHWANAVNVDSFDLLVMPSMEIAEKRPAREIEGYVKEGKMQYCKDCVRK